VEKGLKRGEGGVTGIGGQGKCLQKKQNRLWRAKKETAEGKKGENLQNTGRLDCEGA